MQTIGVNNGNYDTEPDEYVFNAPGLSGKFYLAQDGNWKVECDRPVKVDLFATPNNHLYPPFSPPTWTGNPWAAGSQVLPANKYMEHFEGFTVTDEYGTKYVFGGNDTAYMEYSMDFFNQGKATWICNSWYLKSITRHTGQTVNFKYERGDFVAQMYFSVYNRAGRVNGGSWVSCNDWSSYIGLNGPYDGKLISPIYLTEIASDNFKVKFESTESTELRYTEDIFSTYVNSKINAGVGKADFLSFLYGCFYPVNNFPNGCGNPSLSDLLAKLKWRKLDKIKIQNGSGTTIKEFILTYNNVASERLMLQKIQEKSGYNEKLLPPHEFTYYPGGSLSLPGYSKSHTDHWGYNNGKIINSATDFNAAGSYGATYRAPATDKRYYLLGSLTQIKYPTGGVTKFWMEPHSYTKEVKLNRSEGTDPFIANQIAGGLRVKEIHSIDNVSSGMIKKKYYYISGFNPATPADTSTRLSSGVLGGKSQYYWPDYKPKAEGSGITVEFEVFSTQSVLPGTENSMGSHIGYSEVVQLLSTEGFTVEKYSNFDNGYLDSAPLNSLQLTTTAYEPYNSGSFKRGKLLSRDIYFQNGNPASKTTILYGVFGLLADNVRTVKASAYGLCNTDNRVYEGTAYLLNTQKMLPVEETTYIYDQENASLSTLSATLTAYKPNGQVKEIYITDSKTNPVKVPFSPPNNVYNRQRETAYRYANDFSDAVSQAMTAKNLINAPLETTTRLMIVQGGNATYTPLNWQKVTYSAFDGNYLPSKVESKLGAAATAITDFEFLTYDPRGNLLTFKDRTGSTTKFEYYTTSDVGKVDLLKNNTAANGTAIAQTTTYDHKPLVGISSMSDPNTKVINYDYDDFNRLQTVKNNSGLTRASFCYNYAGQVVDCAALAPTGSIAASSLALISPAPLPVTLLEFTAVKTEHAAVLNWSTTMETNSDRFEIERSLNGKQWVKLGSVDAQGESTDVNTYSFTDNKPVKGGSSRGENLYRLKMIDKDATFAYSRIQSVLFDQSVNLTLYPNPVTVGENLNLEIDDISTVKNIKIFDVNGKQVHQSAASKRISTQIIAAGLYIVQITYTDGSISTHRIVKQ